MPRKFLVLMGKRSKFDYFFRIFFWTVNLNVSAKQFSSDLLNQKDATDLHLYTNHNPNRCLVITPNRCLPFNRHVQSQCWVRTKSPSRLKRKDFARVYQTHQAKNVNNFELLCHHCQTRESRRRAFSSISNFFFRCYSKTTNQRAYRPTYREIARNVILYIKTLNHKLFKKIIFLRKT